MGRNGIENGIGEGRLRRCLVGQPAGQQAVHGDAERVDVGLVRQRFHADLLRRHVRRRADTRDLRGLVAEPLLERGAEVAHLGLAVLRKQDVARLDVAVDHAVLERVLQRADALEDDLDHLVERQQRADVGVRLERLAGHVLHHQVAVVGLDHRVEDVDDVRVVQLAGKRRLGDERLVQHALAVRVGVGVEQEHLDRHLAVGEGIPRQIDAAGGAAADLPQDRVLAQLLFRF